MDSFKKSIAISLAALWAIWPAQAGQPEDAIIAKVTEAYGGATLRDAKSITIVDYSKSPWPGQEGHPGQPDFFRDHAELTIDFEGKRKSMLSWRVSRTGKDLDLFVVNDNEARIYDILNRKYSDEDWLTYASLGRSVLSASDTMMAHALPDISETVVYDGETTYRGALHQKLTVKSGPRPEYTLYINKTSGLISKKVIHRPAGEISYIFSNHRKSGGVTFAQDMNVFVGGQPRKMSIDRNIELNPPLADKLVSPSDFIPWGEQFDTTEMSVRKISDHVYHAGKGRSFTLFVDAGDYFIASGGQDALRESFEALQSQLNTTKPLQYFILTHHHDEHLVALNDAVALGASVVTTSDHLPTVQQSVPTPIPDDRIALVKGSATFGGGVMKVFDIATAHSERYLLVYLPASKVVFGEDHFETQLKTGAPRVHKDMVNFRNAVQMLGIDVERFIDGHSPRALTIAEFLAATDAYRDITCPAGYRICSNG